MSEDLDSSSVWNHYVRAKQAAFGPEESAETQSLEELEAAIAEAAASSGIPEIGMPPRSVVHPTKRSQLSKWFYLTLVVLFAGLVFGLIWWGRKQDMAP
ncbi:hypothetical protein D7Z26_03635 [Cohnella endophytica]|uniref:Uncharacterized protein n=1 Tax=Cohnella endophytica TaxID=2419778 RepID=A0A494Y2Y4_9BACL|nr:hypothetical protein [Cohnella endophytica]RKP57087.1 hypothetical protein D7Z26_03635 [Cohnella endophytica]